MRRQRRNRKLISKGIAATAALGVSISLLAGCSALSAIVPAKTEAVSEQVKTVKVEKVARQRLGEPPEHAAEVVSSVQFEVAAKTGGDVEQVFRRRGDPVQEGETLLRLSAGAAQFERQKAALAVKSAQDALDKAKKDLEYSRSEVRNLIQKMEQSMTDLTRSTNKLKNDYDVGLAKKGQVDQAESQLKTMRLDLDLLKKRQKSLETQDSLSSLQAQLSSSQMALQQAEQALADTEIKAPADGILTDLPLERGMAVSLGARIGIIQKLDPIKIKAQLQEDAAKLVRGKQELTYFIPNTTQTASAKISYLSSVIDAQTKTYELNLEVNNTDMLLKPGMKTRVQLTTEEEQITIAVPTPSVLKTGGETYVYVLNGDTAEKRIVQLGRQNDSELKQEIVSGLQEGELLIVSGQNLLRDKDKVQLTGGE
ncbi:efflux RND transporter periplasmic adaptor subunit [Paenibacillus sp. y28]|uniref:efflux RND transporter periplasmic adaptor subunit n=1 Tax=Paenibacillus sp. y28 TaxID=3129110 RepID=UPI00301A90B9